MAMMSSWVDKISIKSGQAGALASVLLLILILMDVLLRFLFSTSYNFLIELEWHVFGLIFLLGGSFNVLKDKHVRVDFYYADFSENRKKVINLVFHVLFLVPWSLLGMYTCFRYASNSFYIREASANPGGIPALYPIKFVVVLSFFLLLWQAIFEIGKEFVELKKSWKY